MDVARSGEFVLEAEGSDPRCLWNPRLSRAFLEHPKRHDGGERLADRTINQMLAHLRTSAKWVQEVRPFPLGNPMVGIRLLPVGNALSVERAITPTEQRKILDVANILLHSGAQSKDRQRRRKIPRPRPSRRCYRAYRNQAVVHTLIGTGMHRAAVTRLNLADVDFNQETLRVQEKGGLVRTYHVSPEGLEAFRGYLAAERDLDYAKSKVPAPFLPAGTNVKGDGRGAPDVVKNNWKEVAAVAAVKERAPYCACHLMGKHIFEKTENIGAVQRQRVYRNSAYSIQYARNSEAELNAVLNDR